MFPPPILRFDVGRRWLARLGLAAALGLSGTALGATGASGQGTGLEVSADVVLPGLLGLPLGDTGLQSAPPTLSFDETTSVVDLTGGVTIGDLVNLSAGVISGHTEGDLQLNTVESSAGVVSDSDSGAAGLDLSVSLLDLLGVTADAIESTAQASCNAGTPEFSSTTDIANLSVDVLGSGVATANGLIPANTELVNMNIEVPSLFGPIKIAELKLILHEQTTTANSIEVNALRLQLKVLGQSMLGFGVLDLDLKVGASMAQLDDCADLSDVDVDIRATDINRGNQTAVPVTGICTPDGDYVNITVTDGTTTTSAGAANCAADGTYSADVDASGLDDGPVTFTATQDGVSATDTVNKDTALSVSITSATDPINAGNETGVAANGYCTADGGYVSVSFSDGTTVVGPTDESCQANGTWNIGGVDASGLADGTITITATQGSGNDQATDTRSVTKDSSGAGPGPGPGPGDPDAVSIPVGGLLWTPLLALAMGLGAFWRRRRMSS